MKIRSSVEDELDIIIDELRTQLAQYHRLEREIKHVVENKVDLIRQNVHNEVRDAISVHLSDR